MVCVLSQAWFFELHQIDKVVRVTTKWRHGFDLKQSVSHVLSAQYGDTDFAVQLLMSDCPYEGPSFFEGC